MIYTVSGTRRSAALAGLDPQSDAAIQWLRLGMLSCVELIFAHGVQHILMPLLTPSQFKETTVNYHEKLWKWVEDGLIGKQAVTDFQARGWQVRFLFADQSPRLQRMNASLAQATPERQAPCLWLYVIPQPGQLWQWMLEIFQEKAPQNQAQAIHQLYGADIPPATLSLDFGKPISVPAIVCMKPNCAPSYTITPLCAAPGKATKPGAPNTLTNTAGHGKTGLSWVWVPGWGRIGIHPKQA